MGQTVDDVRVDFDGIAAVFDGGDAWVEFAPDRPVELALYDAMTGALLAANEAAMPDDIGDGVYPTVAGGALLLRWQPDDDVLRRWLDVVASQMRARDWTGLLHAAPRVLDLDLTPPDPGLTVFASYDMPPDLELCESAAQWAIRNGGPDVYLNSGMLLADRPGELGRHLYLAVTGTYTISAMCVSERPGPSSSIGLVGDGQASYQVYDPRLTPFTQVGAAREALLAAVGHTRWAGAMLISGYSYSWQTLNKTVGQKWVSPSWTGGRNNPVWSSYVPDAFGMQLLTSDHLGRTRDLSGWAVSEAGPDRYLVEALELGEWFGPAGPSAEVVAAARADFGPAIAPADLPER
jgi:hypothetical protein